MFLGHGMKTSDLQRISDHVNSLKTPAADHILQTADEFAELIADPDTSFVLFPSGYIKVNFKTV